MSATAVDLHPSPSPAAQPALNQQETSTAEVDIHPPSSTIRPAPNQQELIESSQSAVEADGYSADFVGKPSANPFDSSQDGLPSSQTLRQTRLVNATNFTRACDSNYSFDFSKPNVIMGDANLRSFSSDKCSLIFSSKGRLSFFKSALVSVDNIYEHVTTFIICLSMLDCHNKPFGNFHVLRNVIFHARRLFPNATVFVLLHGIPSNVTEEIKTNMCELNALICEKKPGNCEPIHSANDLTIEKNMWGQAMRDAIFDILKSFL